MNQHTIPYNPSEPADLQTVHGFTTYHMDLEERKVSLKTGIGELVDWYITHSEEEQKIKFKGM